jgi:hypothetical protein
VTAFIDPKKRERLVRISASIEEKLHARDPTLFFAAFIALGGEVVYLANGDRAEMCRLLAFWVEHANFNLDFDPNRKGVVKKREETRQEADERIAVERHCAELGKELARTAPIAFFVFKNNEDCVSGVGINAHFVSLGKARVKIAAWLKRQETPA